MSTKHLSYLDSLRGLACMTVVIFHLFIFVYPGIQNGAYLSSTGWKSIMCVGPLGFLFAGNAAVCLFFILSGYVLSYPSIGNAEMKWKLIAATIKRPIRLGGIFLFAVCLGCIQDFNHVSELVTFFKNNCMIDFLMNLGKIANNPLWTIPIELIGSFITFGICFLIGNWNKYVRMSLLVTLALCLNTNSYFPFIFGIIIADLSKNWTIQWFISHKKIISILLFIPAFYLFSYPHFLYRVYLDTPYRDVTFIAAGYSMIGAMLMFVSVCSSDYSQKVLSWRPLVFIGEISYSIYATHMPLIAVIVGSVLAILKFILMPTDIAFLISSCIGLPIIVVIACLVDKYVDKPSIRFSAWFANGSIDKIHQYVDSMKNGVKRICKARSSSIGNSFPTIEN